PAVVGREEGPFQARGEARSPTPAQPGGLDELDDVRRLLGDGRAPRVVTMVLGVGLLGPGVLGVPAVTANRSVRALLTPPCAVEGACHACSRERRSPCCAAWPAPTRSFARASAKPASTRETSWEDPAVAGQRLGWKGWPARMAATNLRI